MNKSQNYQVMIIVNLVKHHVQITVSHIYIFIYILVIIEIDLAKWQTLKTWATMYNIIDRQMEQAFGNLQYVSSCM